MHIFIRGERGVGKSTLVDSAVTALRARQPLTVGGFMTHKRDDEYVCITAASVPRDYASTIPLGLPGTDAREAFDSYAPQLLASARSCDLIVLDELGSMERSAAAFQDAVVRCLSGSVPVLGVIKSKPIAWYARLLTRDDVIVLDVDERNRAACCQKIVQLLSTAGAV